MPINIKKKIFPEERYRYFLKIVSAINSVGLSDLEIEILDLIFIQGGEINSVVRQKICDTIESKTSSSKIVKSISIHNLNNYIVKLRKKKMIIGDSLHPSIMIVIPEEHNFLIGLNFIA